MVFCHCNSLHVCPGIELVWLHNRLPDEQTPNQLCVYCSVINFRICYLLWLQLNFALVLYSHVPRLVTWPPSTNSTTLLHVHVTVNGR